MRDVRFRHDARQRYPLVLAVWLVGAPPVTVDRPTDQRRRRVPLSMFSAADLLAPDESVGEPVRPEPPDRPSTLKGRPLPRRGHGASEGDPSL